jgi:hypothetical protein
VVTAAGHSCDQRGLRLDYAPVFPGLGGKRDSTSDCEPPRPQRVGPPPSDDRILVGKIFISFLAILGGFTIGREGPTIHVGAALMFNLRAFYPKRFRAMRGGALERRLASGLVPRQDQVEILVVAQ